MHVVVTNEPHDPTGIGTFGVDGIVVKAQDLVDLIEKARLLTLSRGRHTISIRTHISQAHNQ